MFHLLKMLHKRWEIFLINIISKIYFKEKEPILTTLILKKNMAPAKVYELV